MPYLAIIQLYNSPLTYLDSECLVDLILDRQSVTVPAEPALHVKATLVSISSHYILCMGHAHESNYQGSPHLKLLVYGTKSNSFTMYSLVP